MAASKKLGLNWLHLTGAGEQSFSMGDVTPNSYTHVHPWGQFRDTDQPLRHILDCRRMLKFSEKTNIEEHPKSRERSQLGFELGPCCCEVRVFTTTPQCSSQ